MSGFGIQGAGNWKSRLLANFLNPNNPGVAILVIPAIIQEFAQDTKILSPGPAARPLSRRQVTALPRHPRASGGPLPSPWIPACAGMTGVRNSCNVRSQWIPACPGMTRVWNSCNVCPQRIPACARMTCRGEESKKTSAFSPCLGASVVKAVHCFSASPAYELCVSPRDPSIVGNSQSSISNRQSSINNRQSRRGGRGTAPNDKKNPKNPKKNS